MKTIIILAACALASCTTSTSTAPDGTVTKTESIDSNAIMSSAAVAKMLIDRNSGK